MNLIRHNTAMLVALLVTVSQISSKPLPDDSHGIQSNLSLPWSRSPALPAGQLYDIQPTCSESQLSDLNVFAQETLTLVETVYTAIGNRQEPEELQAIDSDAKTYLLSYLGVNLNRKTGSGIVKVQGTERSRFHDWTFLF